MQTALLLHCCEWDIHSDELILRPGIRLGKFAGSGIKTLYESLCAKHHLDDGDPFFYNAYVVIDRDNYWGEFGKTLGTDSWSMSTRILNSLAIALGVPFGNARLIYSRDSFATCYDWDSLYPMTETDEGLRNWNDAGYDRITVETIEMVGRLLDRQLYMLTNRNSNERIISSVDFFYHSWMCENIGFTCLNLSIVLETLFSPSTGSEISHQVAYNFAKYHAVLPDERQDMYKLIKKFYSCRSKITHAGIYDWDSISETCPQVFRLMAKSLRTILANDSEFQRFSNKKIRQEYFERLLFE